jgi:hypothetical protein
MFMSVDLRNTINVSKIIYKCRAPILLLPVSNLSSILTLSTFTSLGMYNNASPFKSFLDHCCSVPLLSTPQSRKKIVPIGMVSRMWKISRMVGWLSRSAKMKASDNEDGLFLRSWWNVLQLSGIFPVEKLHFGVGWLAHWTGQRLSQFLLK